MIRDNNIQDKPHSGAQAEEVKADRDSILDLSDQGRPSPSRENENKIALGVVHQRAQISFDATVIHRQSSELKPISKQMLVTSRSKQ